MSQRGWPLVMLLVGCKLLSDKLMSTTLLIILFCTLWWHKSYLIDIVTSNLEMACATEFWTECTIEHFNRLIVEKNYYRLAS